MSRWVGKTVIGLTGNIGTGKSIVRQMLEHLGAMGIDADAISHQVIERGASGYLPVVEYFGRYILLPDGEIDRSRLGHIVFSDPAALQMLESIIHPRVTEAIDRIIEGTVTPVIVIEAIKLFEGTLGKDCSTTWVVKTSPEIQLKRLIDQRKMTEADARQRIEAQTPQELKISQADEVIDNSGSLDDTWQQVKKAWLKLFPNEERLAALRDSAFDAVKGSE